MLENSNALIIFKDVIPRVTMNNQQETLNSLVLNKVFILTDGLIASSENKRGQ